MKKMMKKNISYGLTALLFAVIFALALALIGCGGDNGGKADPEPECDCNVKVHAAPCDCPAAGTPACDCTEEQPKAQHSPDVPMSADKTATITTDDTFTDTQWNAIVTAIVGKFSTGYDAAGPNRRRSYEEAFDRGFTIIVEKKPTEYINYKYTRIGRILYVRSNGVDSLNTNDIVLAVRDGYDIIDDIIDQ